MEGMQIKHKVLYAGRRKVLRVTSLATNESGPFIAADDPIRIPYGGVHDTSTPKKRQKYE